MTEAESKERAERLVTPLFPEWGGRLHRMIDEVARELRRVAEECGWQKEELAKQMHKANEIIRQIEAMEQKHGKPPKSPCKECGTLVEKKPRRVWINKTTLDRKSEEEAIWICLKKTDDSDVEFVEVLK